MGFVASSEQITVRKLEDDGNGGFWWVSLNGQGNTHGLGYIGSGSVRHAGQLYGRNTFKQLMAAMIQNSVALPATDVSIDIEGASERHGLASQFRAPQLTGSDLDTLAANYDPVDFLVKFGIFPLVRRFYARGLITLAQLGDVLIALGQQAKISRTKVENVTDSMLLASQINQNQYNAFWTRWDNEVGI